MYTYVFAKQAILYQKGNKKEALCTLVQMNEQGIQVTGFVQ